MSKKFGKHNSRYSQKLARRKAAGPIHYSFPVNKNGEPTLNEFEQAYEGGKVKTRMFSRLARSNEV